MNIKLFINKSEDNKVYKNIEYINDVSGELRLPTNILSPIIDIEVSDYKSLSRILDIVYIDNGNENDIVYTEDDEEYEVDVYTMDERIFNVNYIYIDEFNRYYFVKNIECLSNKLFRLYLSVDVLMSHKESFMPLKAFISRNENIYNTLLNDDRVSFRYDKRIDVENLLRYDIIDTPYNLKSFGTAIYDNHVILCCDSKQGDYHTNGEEPLAYDGWATTQSGFDSLGDLPSGTREFLGQYTTLVLRQPYGNPDTEHFIRKVLQACIDDDTIQTHIHHLMVYPFKPDDIGYYETIKRLPLGKNSHITFEFNTRITIPKNALERVIVEHFEIPSESFLSYSPYTKYEFYLPYYGWVELSGESFLDEEVVIYYDVNFLDGSATANIYNKDKDIVIFTGKCQVGVQFPLDTTNAKEIENRKIALGSSTAIGLISSVLTLSMGIATKNPVAFGGGVISGAKTIESAVVGANQLYDIGKVDMSNSNSGVTNGQQVLLKRTEMMPNINPTSPMYKKYNGRPLNFEYKLNTLSGYTEVSDIHLEDIDAMQDEKSNIETLLKNGVII